MENLLSLHWIFSAPLTNFFAKFIVKQKPKDFCEYDLWLLLIIKPAVIPSIWRHCFNLAYCQTRSLCFCNSYCFFFTWCRVNFIYLSFCKTSAIFYPCSIILSSYSIVYFCFHFNTNFYYRKVDLPRIELGYHRCKRCVLPLDYRPNSQLKFCPFLMFSISICEHKIRRAAYILYIFRRWSHRRFPYGDLVTT